MIVQQNYDKMINLCENTFRREKHESPILCATFSQGKVSSTLELLRFHNYTHTLHKENKWTRVLDHK